MIIIEIERVYAMQMYLLSLNMKLTGDCTIHLYLKLISFVLRSHCLIQLPFNVVACESLYHHRFQDTALALLHEATFKSH